MRTICSLLLTGAVLASGTGVFSQTRRPGDLRIASTLRAGDPAPDFKLAIKDGKGAVQLSSFKGKRPVVLIFGSYTCPPFRGHVGSLEGLYDEYKDKAEFFVVYIKEAHPSDGWVMPANERQGISIKDATTFDERLKAADNACTVLKIKIPCLVDAMDDTVNKAYAGWPDRVYVVGVDGKIAVAGGQGPQGFAPAVLETRSWLEKRLARAGSAKKSE